MATDVKKVYQQAEWVKNNGKDRGDEETIPDLLIHFLPNHKNFGNPGKEFRIYLPWLTDRQQPMVALNHGSGGTGASAQVRVARYRSGRIG
jgi:hypothetical protein